jgi:glycosyltransferase involved in cell wall biosynthesis
LGTLDYHKGVDFLYKTASQIENKKINFIFAGEPSIKNKFLSKILHFLGIKKNIYDVIESNEYKFMTNLIFFGKIYNLEKFYSIIDIICFPSRMNALGRPVIEAASYGIPAIVTLKKYYNDTIISNKTGKIIKFGDIGAFKKNISYFFNNKKKLKLYGRRALRNFKKVHNKEKNLKKLINLYVE